MEFSINLIPSMIAISKILYCMRPIELARETKQLKKIKDLYLAEWITMGSSNIVSEYE